jgi:hypothetical protein
MGISFLIYAFLFTPTFTGIQLGRKIPCFTPFCFNAPYQFSPLNNLRPLIFGLKLFG